jgi:hypothetical protein
MTVAAMKEQQADLVDRLRALLADESSTREVPMFGGRAFMVNEKMVVSALKGGDLLVRVAVERDGELTAMPGVTRAEMGAGRSMGPGWIEVSAYVIASTEQLSFWLGVAMENNRATG